MMNIKLIKTENDYQEAVAAIEMLWDAAPGSAEFEQLELLGMLVDAYEEQHFPYDAPDPIDLITFYMEQNELKSKDLAVVIGSKARASEIINRKKGLTLKQIRALHLAWHLPADCLIQEPHLQVA